MQHRYSIFNRLTALISDHCHTRVKFKLRPLQVHQSIQRWSPLKILRACQANRANNPLILYHIFSPSYSVVIHSRTWRPYKKARHTPAKISSVTMTENPVVRTLQLYFFWEMKKLPRVINYGNMEEALRYLFLTSTFGGTREIFRSLVEDTLPQCALC